MAVRALPANHAILHEEDNSSVDSCERQHGGVSEFLQHERSDGKERHEQHCECELESQQRLPSVRSI
jgi:hypothetical protein